MTMEHHLQRMAMVGECQQGLVCESATAAELDSSEVFPARTSQGYHTVVRKVVHLIVGWFDSGWVDK